MAIYGGAKKRTSGGTATVKRSSKPSSSGGSSSSGRVPANSYGTGEKYAGGSTMKRADGSTYEIKGEFTSPSGKVSYTDDDGNITTLSSRDKSQNGTVYTKNSDGSYSSNYSQKVLSDYDGSMTPESSYIQQMNAAAEAAQRAQEAKTEAAVSALAGNRSSIEQDAQEAARQAYISKMLAMKNMPQQLKATGSSGGMTDSAVLRMNSDYENNRNNIMLQRNNAINDLNSQIAQIRAQGEIAAAQSESEWAQKIAQLRYQLAKDEQTAKAKATSGAVAANNTKTFGGFTYDEIINNVKNGIITPEYGAMLLGLPEDAVPKTDDTKNPTIAELSQLYNDGVIDERQYKNLALNNNSSGFGNMLTGAFDTIQKGLSGLSKAFAPNSVTQARLNAEAAQAKYYDTLRNFAVSTGASPADQQKVAKGALALLNSGASEQEVDRYLASNGLNPSFFK